MYLILEFLQLASSSVLNLQTILIALEIKISNEYNFRDSPIGLGYQAR